MNDETRYSRAQTHEYRKIATETLIFSAVWSSGGPCEHTAGPWGLSCPLWSEWAQIITLTDNRHLSPCAASFALLTKWSCQLRVAPDALPADWRVSKTSITGLFLWQKTVCIMRVYCYVVFAVYFFSGISQSRRLSCYDMNDYFCP